MPRKEATNGNQKHALRRAVSAVTRLFSRGRGDLEATEATTPPTAPARATKARRPETGTARVTRREADIGLDVLDRAYTPASTSSKASFRSDGSDHQTDQEFAYGVSDERWNDEDRITNKSGDPRIGTHRRTYEPGEAQAEKID